MLPCFMRDVYNEGSFTSYTEEELSDILADIELFSMSASFFHRLQGDPRAGQLPGPFLGRLKEEADRTLFRCLLIKRETDELLRIFEREGVEAIPLKGTGFAERYFGHFAARDTTDVDLLVRRDRLQQAIRCAHAAGYVAEETYGKTHYHVQLQKEPLLPGLVPLTVELHWSFDESFKSKLDMERFWSDSQPVPGSRYVRRLTVQDEFYAICIHGIKHRMNSLKYVLDAGQMLMAAGEAIDLPALCGQAERDGTRSGLGMALAIVNRIFPSLAAVGDSPLSREVAYWDYGLIRSMAKGEFDPRSLNFHLRFPLAMLDGRLAKLRYLRYYVVPAPELAEYFVGRLNGERKLALYWRFYRARWRLFQSGRRKSKGKGIHDV